MVRRYFSRRDIKEMELSGIHNKTILVIMYLEREQCKHPEDSYLKASQIQERFNFKNSKEKISFTQIKRAIKRINRCTFKEENPIIINYITKRKKGISSMYRLSEALYQAMKKIREEG